MSRQTFTWGISNQRVRPEERLLELLCIFGLLLAALILYSINLGELPLRDWDEGTVAQVAKEIYQAPFSQLKWLFPTLWDEPYLNKPPLIHNLIALSYAFWGVNEFSSRIVGAFLTALSVPLLYCVGRELFVPRYYALFAALVYLTTFPVVRHGRLAMLDGAVLCFEILMFLCLLRSRRDLRWTLGAGIAFGLICLTKGWMLGLLIGAIAFLFLLWDTPRLLTSLYSWVGLLIGFLPVVTWQILQWLHYGQNFVNTSIVNQSLERIYSPVEGNTGPVWYYLIELLKYPHPWLFLAIFGFSLAWQYRNWSWGKLILTWSLSYFVIISIMMTKLPWYILPLYPVVALAAGVAIADVKSWPNHRSYPYPWIIFFSIFSLAIAGGILYFAASGNKDYGLSTILGLLALTMAIVAIMLNNRDQQFIVVLFWGMYVALVLFFSSDYWLWELNEAFPVKPVANLIQDHVPVTEKVYTAFDYERPSLNFYSDKKVIPLSQVVGEESNQEWQNVEEFWQDQNNHYLLVNKIKNYDILTQLKLSEIDCHKPTEANDQFSELNIDNQKTNAQVSTQCFTTRLPSDWLLIAKEINNSNPK